jgi:hypothetical protein
VLEERANLSQMLSDNNNATIIEPQLNLFACQKPDL